MSISHIEISFIRPQIFCFSSQSELDLFISCNLGVRVPDSRRQAAPAYSFGSRRNKDQCDSIGPGPAQYNVSGLGAKGKDTPPAMSLQSRPKAKSQFLTPAPGEYNIDRADKNMAPKYTFGLKTVADKPKETPGLNH